MASLSGKMFFPWSLYDEYNRDTWYSMIDRGKDEQYFFAITFTGLFTNVLIMEYYSLSIKMLLTADL